VIDSAGFVRFKASVAAAGLGSISEMNTPRPINLDQAEDLEFPPTASSQQSPAVNDLSVPATGVVNSWSFGLGKEIVRVQTSQELSMDLWEKLEQYVRVLKPTGSSQEQ
jgi:hypothetical protein